MTFEELKFEILDRQRKKEINKLFHLYVKAETYSDMLRIVKTEGNIKWILSHGFQDLLNYFPVEELENEGFYSREVSFIDVQKSFYILPGGVLNLKLTQKNRCKIVCIGGKINIDIASMAMVDLETFGRSNVKMTADDISYGYLIARGYSTLEMIGKGKSTFFLTTFDNAKANVNINDSSYVNMQKNDDSEILINE